jgi:hypothetical protein
MSDLPPPLRPDQVARINADHRRHQRRRRTVLVLAGTANVALTIGFFGAWALNKHALALTIAGVGIGITVWVARRFYS